MRFYSCLDGVTTFSWCVENNGKEGNLIDGWFACRGDHSSAGTFLFVFVILLFWLSNLISWYLSKGLSWSWVKAINCFLPSHKTLSKSPWQVLWVTHLNEISAKLCQMESCPYGEVQVSYFPPWTGPLEAVQFRINYGHKICSNENRVNNKSFWFPDTAGPFELVLVQMCDTYTY